MIKIDIKSIKLFDGINLALSYQGTVRNSEMTDLVGKIPLNGARLYPWTFDSMHYRQVISYMESLIAPATTLIVTHNCDVIDRFPIVSPQQVCGSIILFSKSAVNNAIEAYRYDDDEANKIIESHNVSVEQVSDILRNRGLW